VEYIYWLFCLMSISIKKNIVMKQIAILILIAIITIPGYGQNKDRNRTRSEVKKYIETAILPELIVQQNNYLDRLSESEIKDLREIKSEIAARHEVKGQNHQNNKRANHNSGHGRNGSGKDGQSKYRDELSVITSQHQDLNDSYRTFIENNRQQWSEDITKIHENMDIQSRRSKDGNTGMDVFFTRISNPDWLLLWESSDSLPYNPRSRRIHKRGHNYMGTNDRVSSNPELRSDIRTYISENVIPVITKERLEFNDYLSDDEKETIETARQKIQVRKIMFRNWYESEDFVPGKRAHDPNFDAMREDMQASMKEVKLIADKYAGEIQNSLASINSGSHNWKENIKEIVAGYDMDSEKMKRLKRHNKFIPSTPVKFLLFDPSKENKPDDITGNIRVVIYPVPITSNAVISVTGAEDHQVVITLFSKEGTELKELYNLKNTEEKFEVDIDTDDLKNGIYIVKVNTENSTITRKIVVEK